MYHSLVHGLTGSGSFSREPLRNRSGMIWYQIASLAQSGVLKFGRSDGSNEYTRGSRTLLAPSLKMKVYSVAFGGIARGTSHQENPSSSPMLRMPVAGMPRITSCTRSTSPASVRTRTSRRPSGSHCTLWARCGTWLMPAPSTAPSPSFAVAPRRFASGPSRSTLFDPPWPSGSPSGFRGSCVQRSPSTTNL